MWMDNRIDPTNIALGKAGTLLPPLSMGYHILNAPRLSALFINVLQNLITVDIPYNVTNKSGSVLGQAIYKQIINTQSYIGMHGTQSIYKLYVSYYSNPSDKFCQVDLITFINITLR